MPLYATWTAQGRDPKTLPLLTLPAQPPVVMYATGFCALRAFSKKVNKSACFSSVPSTQRIGNYMLLCVFFWGVI